MDKTAITRLLRCSWEAVANIVTRVVADQLHDARLEQVYRIGVDEVSYRKGHRYLTVVADHDRDGAVIWAGEGKTAATLEQFYDQLGEARSAQLQAVSLDLGAAFKKATDAKAPQARQCVDPFHLVALANEAINKARRWAWNLERDKARQAAVLAGPKRRELLDTLGIRPADSFGPQPKGGRNDLTRFFLDLVQMVGAAERLGVDLVDVLRAGRTGGEPGRVGDHLEAADLRVVAGRLGQLGGDRLPGELGGLHVVR